MTRTTKRDLDALAKAINGATGAPVEPWSNGKANIGCCHVSGAYGGYALHRVATEHGGIEDVSRIGYVSAKELHLWMRAHLAGIEAGRMI
jgi:hypothetical protein